MAYKTRIIYFLGLLVSCYLIIHPAYAYAQSTWAHTYGGSDLDIALSIKQTSDGGYIVAGETYSFGAGHDDCWIVKLDSSGNVIWQKTYGGTGDDNASAIQQTSDGGYIVAANTDSFGAGNEDIWIFKLDSNGDVVWQKTYGSGQPSSIQQTSDGGYIVAAGGMLILKLDSSGNVVWQKTYGGAQADNAFSIAQTSDGGYIVAGSTESYGAGYDDFWILKLDTSGNVTWQKTYGGSSSDYAQSIQQTSDGGYIVAGITWSFGSGSADYWILKLDSSGNVTWQKTYGGSELDIANSIQQTSDGGYIVAGYTTSFGSGYDDFWILKLDASGNVTWQKTYGGSDEEFAYAIKQTSDGGYIAAGESGSAHFWVLKLKADGTMDSSCSFIHDTSILPVNSSATIADTNAAVSSPSITIASTGIAGVYSSGTDTLNCSSCSVPAGLTNNTVTDTQPCIYTGVHIGWNVDPAKWSDGSTGTRTYDILRDENAIATGLPYGMTSYIDTSGTHGQTYLYKVRYKNGCGSAAATPGVQTADYPKAPTAMNTIAHDKSAQFDSGVDISWSIPTDWGDQGINAAHRRFRVYRDSTDISGLLPASTLTYEDTIGINNTYYTYHVDAINGCGVANSYKGMLAIDAVTQVTDWAHIYSGLYGDSAQSIGQTSDGGYIVAGITDSSDQGYDIWILKLDSSGNVSWQKTYGGANDDYAFAIQQTSDGGYIVAGDTQSFGAGGEDIWILRLDSSGNVSWQKTYGGANDDFAESIRQTGDGGYIVAGETNSFGANDYMWILKLDSSGNVSWQKTYSGSNYDYARSIQQTSDGGYIVAGDIWSLGTAHNDIWILKLDSSGSVIWQKSYGGSGYNYAYSVRQTSDGGYIVAGFTNSFGAGYDDIWILKLNASGNVDWQKTYGGTNFEEAYSVQQASDGGFIIAGDTDSFGLEKYSFWVLKINQYGTMNSACNFINSTSIIPIDTTASSADTSATGVSTSCSVSDTSITGTSSNGSDFLLCASTLFLKPYNNEKPVVIDSGSPTSNGIIEPDEMVELEGTLENTGSTGATSVTGLLTSIDPINISNPDAAYPDILSNDHKTCTSCYSLAAFLINRPATHWDFEVTENVSAVDFGPQAYHYLYHVGHSFSDVPPSYLFYPYIEKILHSGVTSGCTDSTYCPSSNVLREQMAKFICASMEASHPGICATSYCSGIFTDIPYSSPFCPYIEQLYNIGIVAGCQTNPLMYCPDAAIQRQAMAKLVCLGMQSANPGSCVTADCTGIFTDVPTTNPFCPYIEALYNAGIVSGCGANTYCPASFVSRGQMSKFLANGFGFEL